MGSQRASEPTSQPFTLCLCCFVSGFGRHKHNSESRLPVRQQCRGCSHGGQSPSGLPTMVWTAFLLHHHCMKPACHVPCAMCDVELVAWAPVDLLVVPLSLFLPQLQTVPHAIGVERGTRKPRCSPQLPSYQPTSLHGDIPSPPTSPEIQSAAAEGPPAQPTHPILFPWRRDPEHVATMACSSCISPAASDTWPALPMIMHKDSP
jgi:hypothetical protein